MSRKKNAGRCVVAPSKAVHAMSAVIRSAGPISGLMFMVGEVSHLMVGNSNAEGANK